MEKVKEENIKSGKGDGPFSIHTFMFPFRWDYIADKKKKIDEIPFNERTDLGSFNKIFSSQNTLKRVPFETKGNNAAYNEYTYFHAFVRKALFDLGVEDKGIKEVPDNQIMCYYEVEKEEKGATDYYEINVLGEPKPYRLKLVDVCLHVFSTGIGVLTFNLENTDYSDKEDILKINEYGRRIYPQFLHEDGISNTKKAFLADSIKGEIGGIKFFENFIQYNNAPSVNQTFLPPDHIRQFFKNRDESRSGDFIFLGDKEEQGKIRISLVSDDRMFFMCYFRNADLANSLAIKRKEYDQTIYKYQLDNFWYAYVFGDKNDKDTTIKDDFLQIEQTKFHTYTRWIDCKSKNEYNGTLYGMSRDSFVAIGDWSEILIHMRTMYYQMAILCLVQRASVLRFSCEVSHIADSMSKKKSGNKQVGDLYANYIKFINKICFREVTSQIQGIEIYDKFQQVMNIEKDTTDLDREIEELHNHVSLKEQEQLNFIATFFIPASLVLALFGISNFPEFDFSNGHWFNKDVVIAFVLSLSSSGIYYYFKKQRN